MYKQRLNCHGYISCVIFIYKIVKFVSCKLKFDSGLNNLYNLDALDWITFNREVYFYTRVRIISSIVKNKSKTQVAILFLHDLMKSEDMKSQSREYEKWDDHAFDKLLE